MNEFALAMPPSTKPQSPSQPASILIAEDEHLLARDLSHELGELGFKVVGPAANGRAAVELAEQHRPDLALLDLRMPEMDGIEAGKIIYERFGIPVVVLTAHSDDTYINAAQEMGVFGYLLKPAEAEELRITIRVAWARFLEQRDLRDDVSSLERKLEERKLIERAKGVLMQKLSLTEPEAMKRLQKQARDTRRPMADLARSILDAEQMLGG